MISIGLLGLLAAIDPCAPVPTDAVRDPDAAAAYLTVAEEELLRGADETAATALHDALRHDPDNATAREVLARLCEGGRDDRLLDQAIEAMNRGERTEAVTLFEAARAARDQRPAPAADLLEGICRYELGDDVRAQPLLTRAQSDPELAPSADFFLGLIALRRGDGSEAEGRFAAAATRDPSLRGPAGELRRISRREGKLMAAAQLQGGYDTNVGLAPGTAGLPSGTGDVAIAGAASFMFRPLGRSGPYAMLGGSYRKQADLPAFDTGTLSAIAGWQLGEGVSRASADYAFDYVAFGGQPYLSGHSLSARGQLPVGRFIVEAEYAARMNQYLTADTAPFSGVVHTGRVFAGWRGWKAFGLDGGYAVSRAFSQSTELSYLEHGPEVRAHWLPATDIRLFGSVSFRPRRSDTVDPDFGVARAQSPFDVALWAELDVNPAWMVLLAIDGRRQTANVPALAYLRLAAWAGVSFSGRVF